MILNSLFTHQRTGNHPATSASRTDFQRDFESMTSRGVEFIRGPVEEAYGTVGVFKDIYGNLWDLIEPKEIEVYQTPYIP